MLQGMFQAIWPDLQSVRAWTSATKVRAVGMQLR